MNRNKFSPKNAGLRQMASHIRSHGQRGDNILAHINPEEAHYLEQTQGMDINPHTGLPQYGLFRSIEKGGRKIFKKALPIAGAVLGNMLMPGLGGTMLGGGIGGAVGNKKDPFKGAMIGAAMGGAGHYMFGSGESPEWISNFGKRIGFTGGASSAAAPQHLGHIGAKEVATKTSTGGWGNKIMGLMKDNPVETGLAAMTLYGTLASKQKKQKGESGHEEGSMSDVIANNQRLQAIHNPPGRNPKPMSRKLKKYTPDEWRSYDPATFQFFEDVNPPTQYYADGGHVAQYGHPMEHDYSHGGYVNGDDGGQSDKIRIKIRPNSYVMDATTTSLLGDGNPDYGNDLLHDWEDKTIRSGVTNSDDYGDSHNVRMIEAFVSPKERVMSEKFVTALGKGDNSKGAKMLDKFRNRVREHKGVKKFLPPKS